MTIDMISPVQCALISVSNRSELEQFASCLFRKGIDILSTGGTQRYLETCGIATTSVSEVTNSPEIMGGRVKTLHPKLHGGILARRGQDDAVMKTYGIRCIDLVVVNFYPFLKTITDSNCSIETAIENIDIGGPTMVRAAAKNYKYVAIIVDPKDYKKVSSEIIKTGGVSLTTRQYLAAKAFVYTTSYDKAIGNYLSESFNVGVNSGSDEINFPEILTLEFTKKEILRYGENPHQKAVFYANKIKSKTELGKFKQLQGKSFSYNNITDIDAALACIKSFTQIACVIVKHANPCGVAIGNTVLNAYQRAFAADNISAFGGIIAFNRPLDKRTAKTIISNQFVEIVIAPEITENAAYVLSEKPNIRVISCNSIVKKIESNISYKSVSGGLLVQVSDCATLDHSKLMVVTKRQPTMQNIEDLQFAWKVVKYVKSNAIVCAKNNQTIGIGAGQMSRIMSAKIATMKAKNSGFDLTDAVMASDAFFPFSDNIDMAAEMGIYAIIQPGGSIKDQEIIDAANAKNMIMIFTGVRHLLH